MANEPVFLGWDGPCLPRAAQWLRDCYTDAGVCDLGDVLVVTPVARAGRRLLELLATPTETTSSSGAAPAVLIPPQIVALGQLPEKLYESVGPVAGALAATLARLIALRDAEAQVLHQVVASPPDRGDLGGWLALARDLEQLHESLAADGVRVDEVAARCQAAPDFNDHRRWDALTALQAAYEHVLSDAGWSDVHSARRAAIDEGRCRSDADVVLVAAADLNEVAAAMLKQVASRCAGPGAGKGAGTVTALVHAPADEADAFDELGRLKVDAWHERALAIDTASVRVVDRPRDQAYEVLKALGDGSPSLSQQYAADQITVGLGDESMGPMIHRVLALADLPARSALGVSVAQSPPAMLLAAAAAYLNGRRLNDLAALLRHPDVEQHLLDTLGADAGSEAHARTADAIGDWLTLLDRYATDHLQGRLSGAWLGDEDLRRRLKQVYDAVNAMLAVEVAPVSPLTRRPLGQWSEPIAQLLRAGYGSRSLDRHEPADAKLERQLKAIVDALREQAELNDDSPLTLELTAAEAITLTLSRLADQTTAPQGGEPSIELLGWLELQLDDAPALVVTGVNEGAIPRSVNADAFLPDGIRRLLGLADNRRRYARDMMAMTAIIHSRPHVTLITGRRDGEDNPLTPSRLLLACQGQALAQRVVSFYDEQGRDESSAAAAAPILLAPGKLSRFLIPPPAPPAEPIDRLRVTAFRDYLACPYRFYLKHVRKLECLDDRAVELDGLAFGSLAHSVLQWFGRSDAARLTKAEAIAAGLKDQLDRLALAHYGAHPPAAVVIQLEQMRRRFEVFAHWQAEHAAAGWRIDPALTEREASTTLDVDGKPFTIRGRIDRIDVHDEHGHLVLDYKTGDTAKRPQETHRQGSAADAPWIDLQLPLYHELAVALGLRGTIALGYVQLPKKAEQTGLAQAEWSAAEITSAVDEARRIIGAIRRGIFWPPSEPPAYTDDLSGICMDACIDRGQIIARSGALVASGSARP